MRCKFRHVPINDNMLLKCPYSYILSDLERIILPLVLMEAAVCEILNELPVFFFFHNKKCDINEATSKDTELDIVG